MRKTLRLCVALVLIALAAPTWPAIAQSAPKPPESPATIAVGVSPVPVAPGTPAHVTVRIEPAAGVKINRYPQTKVEIAASPGVADSASGAVGDKAPPPPEKLAHNYFDRVDPIHVEVPIAPTAKAGKHELTGQVTYYYCVTESGFCAPKKAPIKLAVEVR